MRRLGASLAAFAALVVAGCASSLRPATAPPGPALPRPAAPQPDQPAGGAADLAAAITADAAQSDHESDSKVRATLAAAASGAADACLEKEPHAVACLYGRAVAFGLEARAHPTRAGELLTAMLARLADAESVDPSYDHAGPARVRALVLIRAPGWPLGPGDADAGLVAARRAVALQPQYPANLLALAESLAKTGDASGARQNYERARAVAEPLPPSAERDDWLRQADEALKHQETR